MSSLSGTEKLTGLQSLTVSYNASLRSLSRLEKLTGLRSFEVDNNTSLRSLSGLEKVQRMKILKLGEYEFNLLKNQIYKFKNLEKLIVPMDVSVDYEKLSNNNPGIKLIRENF